MRLSMLLTVSVSFLSVLASAAAANPVPVAPDAGGPRAIFFRMGVPISADTSQADGYGEFSATKDGDLNLIKVGSGTSLSHRSAIAS